MEAKQRQWGSLTAAETALLDRTAAAMGIATASLMENAGRQVAACAQRLYPRQRDFWIVAGTGNNGGDGLVAARHLHRAGKRVFVSVIGEVQKLGGLSLRQYERLAEEDLFAGCVTAIEGSAHPGAVVIDALLGSGLHSAPRPHIAATIQALQGREILSVDLPSGVDATTGALYAPAITARATCTLGAMKRGLWEKEARLHAGQIFVADIGFTPAVFARCGLPAPEALGPGELAEVT